MTRAQLHALAERVERALWRFRAEGALWTSDIAHSVKVCTTAEARRALLALEKAGRVERVATGNPTSWRLTAAALRALAEGAE